MRKPLLIIIFLLLVGIGVAVFIKFPKTHTTNTQPQETELSGDTEVMQSGDNQQLTGSTITTGDENPLVYTNTEFGFQLTLPEGWEDYRVFTYDMKDNGYNSEELASIVIALPTHSPRPGVQDPNDPNRFVSGYTGQYQYITGYASMISLRIWTHQGYKQAINTPDLIRNQETRKQHTLSSGSQYVYTYFGPTDIPDDLMNIWGKKDYFKPILSSFIIL